MASLARIAGALAAAVTVTLVFLLWVGWPGFLAVGAGGVFGVAFLIVATSLGDDPSAADRAWREQAADLAGGPPGAEPEAAADPVTSGEDRR